MRFWSVLLLLVLAPWVGEYLLGNISIERLPLLPFLVPLYGCGALLVRELTRRTGRGWPTIFLLATAYGVIEAGLVDQSLFNQTFESLDQTGVTPVPWLGISAYNAAAFLVGHAVWSIGVPIALVELWFPSRRDQPWLGPVGLSFTALGYLLGCWLIFKDLRDQEGFLAAPHQLTVAAVTAIALIILSFLIPRRRLSPPAGDHPPPLRPSATGMVPSVAPPKRRAAPADGRSWPRRSWASGVVALVGPHRRRAPTADGRAGPPRPWVVGVVTFVTASAHAAVPENWLGFGIDVVTTSIAAVTVAWLARRPGWGDRHLLGLLAGALLTYAWLAFVLTSLYGPDDRLRWIGNGVFAATAVLLLVVTRWVVGRREMRPAHAPEGVSERRLAGHGR
ncbi:hypothetical protein AB0J82_07390 [Asanoa sp. NPDC049518]|uniref:hypothetical protein n=1 Tax=unclassified Asanoa TaxID=2685164 RepID=UPI00343356E5